MGVGVESSVAGAAGNQNSQAIMDYIAIISETVSQPREDLDSQELRQSWDQVKVYNGIQRVGGQVNVEVHPLSFGYLLRGFFDVTTAMNGQYGNTAGPGATSSHASIRSHRFTTGLTQFQSGSGSDVPTLTLEINRGPGFNTDSSFFYYGMAGNVLEINIEAGQLVRASLDMIGRDYGVDSLTTPSLPAADAFLWHQASVTLNGTAKAVFESLTIRANNNLEGVNRIGSGTRTDLIKRNNFRQIEVNGNMSFDNFDDYNQFVGGSEYQLIAHFNGSTTDSGFMNCLRIDVPKFRYSTYPVNLAGPGRISIGFTGRGVLDTTSNYALEVWLTNTRESAYNVSTPA